MRDSDKSYALTNSVRSGSLMPYLVFLLIVSLAQYSLTLGNEFVWDAKITFTEDPTIHDFKYLPDAFLDQSNKSLTNEGNPMTLLKYYRPLTKSLHILEYSWFGNEPQGYKAVNLILNAAVVVLLFLFVHSATKNIQLLLWLHFSSQLTRYMQRQFIGHIRIPIF